jgi:hypothetical protein
MTNELLNWQISMCQAGELTNELQMFDVVWFFSSGSAFGNQSEDGRYRAAIGLCLRVIVWARREAPRLSAWIISLLLGLVTGCLIDQRRQLAAPQLSNEHKTISQFIIIAFVCRLCVRPTLLETRAKLFITCDKQTLNFDHHIPSSIAETRNNTSFDN